MAGFSGPPDAPYAFVIPAEQHDPPTVRKMVRLLERAGVRVERARDGFTAGGRSYPAGTYVARTAQVFGRYLKDMLEAQAYPEVRPAPGLPPAPPYDVTAWSLGLQMGVETFAIAEPFEVDLEPVDSERAATGDLSGSGDVFLVDASLNDGFRLVNRALEDGARVRRARTAFRASGRDLPAGSWVLSDVSRDRLLAHVDELGLSAFAVAAEPSVPLVEVEAPRIALYQPWGSNMDEGWTRWLLDAFEFDYTVLHPQDLRAAGEGRAEPHRIPAEVRASWPPHVSRHAEPEVLASPLSERFDVVLLTHQTAESIVEGDSYAIIPETYRGGIGSAGVDALRRFVDDGGTLVALGAATGFVIEQWPIGVQNVVSELDSESFLIPGSILSLQVDPSHPIGWGMPRDSHGYFIRSPAFALTDGFATERSDVVVRYPSRELKASGWTRGEEHIAARAASVATRIDDAGRLVLLGLRPQHRAQTHATFKLLFNALLWRD